MLISDPPRTYTEISKTLGIAVGSIGRMRARCLDRLRRSPHLNALMVPQAGDVPVKEPRK